MWRAFPNATFLTIALSLAHLAATNARSQSACLVQRVVEQDPGFFDSFGSSVAVQGRLSLIGAPWQDDQGADSGAAYAFEFDGAMWIEAQVIHASDGMPNLEFGEPIAIYGLRSIVGVPGFPNGGAVYFFAHDGVAWSQSDQFIPANGSFGDGLGISVDIRDDLAIAGAGGDDDFGFGSGSAYVFKYEDAQWFMQQQLFASDAAASWGFGSSNSVGIDGDWIAVGAPGADQLIGAVYTFHLNGKTQLWSETQKLTIGDIGHLGDSIAISGQWIAAGHQFPRAVATFLFDPSSSTWAHTQTIFPPPGDDGSFGRAIALDGDTLLVGSWNSDVYGQSDGATYVYRLDGDQWLFEAVLGPQPNSSPSFFGWSVALDGETALVGAYGEDGQSGAAYFFDLAAPRGDLDCDRCVGVEDLAALLAAWGPCESLDCPEDIAPPPPEAGDGIVGPADLAAVLADWGKCP